MNHVLNDRGETVIAEGAPGSVARARCEHPELIKNLTALQKAESATSGLGHVDSATVIAETLYKRGILSPLESTSLLVAAGFSEQNAKEVHKQLQVLIDDHNRSVAGVRVAPRGPSAEATLKPGAPEV